MGEVVRGYKAFCSDWTCRGFQYEVGKEYTMPEKPVCCERGFHFCLKANDCFDYYRFGTDCKFAEVEAFGTVVYHEDDSKACTNGIRIVREIPWSEVLELVNTGKACAGRGNSGNWNSGNRNSGDWNSGNWNSGNRNSGDWNSGNRNSGDWNSGNRNSGDRNSGDWNSGNRNSGDWNSGDWNSGNWNSGDWNSGDWNHTNFSSGIFNTEEQKIRMFNKESDWTYRDWINSRARYILMNVPQVVVEWIWSDDMTDEEKSKYPDYETTGGYLKVTDKRRCATDWWNGLSKNDKDEIKSLPNFDFSVFCECVGIDKERAEQ